MKAVAAASLAVALVFGAAPAWAQEVPDISGVWEAQDSTGDVPPTSTLSDADALIDELFSPIVPPGGEPTLKGSYAAAYDDLKRREREAFEAGTPLSNSHELCVPEGMPQMMMPTMPIEIVQTEGKIIVLTEYLSQVRRIYMDEPMPDPEALNPSYAGYSVARWEGDTLVIEARGVLEDALFFHIPHSPELSVTEYIRLVGPDALEVRLVSQDKAALAEPYEVTFSYKRADPYRPAEYICTGNRYGEAGGASVLSLD